MNEEKRRIATKWFHTIVCFFPQYLTDGSLFLSPRLVRMHYEQMKMYDFLSVDSRMLICKLFKIKRDKKNTSDSIHLSRSSLFTIANPNACVHLITYGPEAIFIVSLNF